MNSIPCPGPCGCNDDDDARREEQRRTAQRLLRPILGRATRVRLGARLLGRLRAFRAHA